MTLDVAAIRADFPILKREVRGGKRLVYLDSAATSQKPHAVLDAERAYYETCNAAVHRGAHQLAEEATTAFEDARATMAGFVGGQPEDLVFTRNATESLNLVAYTFLNATLKAARGVALPEGAERFVLREGDEIVVTQMEHHANLLPWQELCDKTGAVLRWFGITDEGRLDFTADIITERTRAVAFVHQSNILGTINDPAPLVARAREVGAIVVLDACQSVPHLPLSLPELGVDFVAWSGHKMLGPTGIGFLWAAPGMLATMPPFLTGGSMIAEVRMEGSTFADPPQRFEAGVPMIAQTISAAAAARYLTRVGMEAVHAHEQRLTAYALDGLQAIGGVRIIGPATTTDRGAAISFEVADLHPHDVGQVLDDQGIAVRVGHHCAWPTCRRFGVPATTRASFYLYNDTDDIDALLAGVEQVPRFFGVRG